MKKHLLVTITIFLSLQWSLAAQAAQAPIQKKYRRFTLWLDCKTHHGAVAFYYEVGKDKGRLDLKSRPFRFDPKVNTSCQPQTWRGYNTTTVNPAEGTWDRGQLIPSNHMDGHHTALKETYYLTNTLPMHSIFNQPGGAWHETVRITECYRDITPLKIWGGVIWGKNAENDFFTLTHGIKTPDFFWKLIYRKDKKEYVAWLFPNHWSATAAKIDRFLVSLDKLKSAVDYFPDLSDVISESAPATPSKSSWPVEASEKELICEGRKTSRD
ncbi:MAG: DNA/RNA non-specific endonuclease [Nitrospiria bacterium]